MPRLASTILDKQDEVSTLLVLQSVVLMICLGTFYVDPDPDAHASYCTVRCTGQLPVCAHDGCVPTAVSIQLEYLSI
jgi:hypothetical protein